MSQQHLGILKKCLHGNQKAQMQLYDMYANAMYAVAHRYMNNNEDAKDAMQEGFIKAFTHLPQYKGEVAFGAWLKRIIINQCIDILKKRSLAYEEITEQMLTIVDEDHTWDIDIPISKQEIVHGINALPSKYKLVLTLYLLEGYDHQEISEILNIPVRTSRTHLMRGKTKLKTWLHNNFQKNILS